jgi:hypothetical protein
MAITVDGARAEAAEGANPNPFYAVHTAGDPVLAGPAVRFDPPSRVVVRFATDLAAPAPSAGKRTGTPLPL